jgi:hypothetical protein
MPKKLAIAALNVLIPVAVVIAILGRLSGKRTGSVVRPDTITASYSSGVRAGVMAAMVMGRLGVFVFLLDSFQV